MSHSLRILHLSDYHERAAKEPDPAERHYVFGENWQKNVMDIFTDCDRTAPVDLVCFTGDLAFSGREDEYAEAAKFLDDLLTKLKVPRERFFVVPGNHDVDRTINNPTWEKFRTSLHQADARKISKWIAGRAAPLGFDANEADHIIERQRAYRTWLKDFGRDVLLPDPKTHPRLGYRQTVQLERLPFPIHVIGLDSAWLAGDDADAGKLRLTTDQVMRLANDEQGKPLAGFRLALIHHPLEQLSDGAECRDLLAERTDALLRGHQHDPRLSLMRDPDRSLLELAAGCLYEHDRYPNSHHIIDITLDDKGRPLQYDLWFRGWSKRGFWHNQNDLYGCARDGRLTWQVSNSPEEMPQTNRPQNPCAPLKSPA
jgi:predicted MPP superfamily phosphohydrolase